MYSECENVLNKKHAGSGKVEILEIKNRRV